MSVTRDDFVFHLPTGKVIFLPTKQVWRKLGVDAALGKIDGVRASTWLAQNRGVLSIDGVVPRLLRQRRRVWL